MPGGPGEAEAALEQLVARGFLVTRSGRRSYTVHPLVRVYAERQAWGSDEGAVAISRAASHLERIGENHRAASLYLRAGRFDDAARPLRALALSSLNAVVDFAHEGWADLLPGDDDASAGAWLLVAKGADAPTAGQVRSCRGPLRAGGPALGRRRRQRGSAARPARLGCSACSTWVSGTRVSPWSSGAGPWPGFPRRKWKSLSWRATSW